MKTIRFALTLGITVATVAACGGGSSSNPSGSSSQKIKIGVITATPIDQGSYDPAQYKAYKAVADKYGWQLTVAEAIPYGQGEQTLTRFAQEGMNVIASTDQGFEKSFLDVAAKYPNITFVMASDLSTFNGLSNVTSYVFNTYDMGCLAGASAALVSQSHKIGGLTGLPIPAALQAFGGAGYCANVAVPGATLKTASINSFTDASKGNEVAASVYATGVDAMFGILGSTTPGVLTATKAANGKYVGWLVDESSFGPEVTATSILYNFNRQWEAIAQAIMSHKIEPKVHRLGIAEGAITAAPFRLGYSSLDSKIEQLINSIKSGSITVPQSPAPAP